MAISGAHVLVAVLVPKYMLLNAVPGMGLTQDAIDQRLVDYVRQHCGVDVGTLTAERDARLNLPLRPPDTGFVLRKGE